jgi:transcriptional regulator with XRE-family HTH domain
VSFGATVRSARKDRGLSQRQVADKVRKEDGSAITQQYLNDIELERRIPSPHVIKELARALHLDLDLLNAMAGQMPQDVDLTRYEPERIVQAMKAFRKTLRG